MKETVTIQRSESYDVVVCGGGPAGFCAAVAAARGGACHARACGPERAAAAQRRRAKEKEL